MSLKRVLVFLFFIFTPWISLTAAEKQVITNGSRAEKKIALTFDACPAHDARVDWGIIQTLIRTNTPATLFLSGKWMIQFPEATRTLATFPQFELGNHSDSHPHMTRLSDSSIRSELEKTQEILRSLTGQNATHFRPPYGEYNDRVVDIAKDLGLETVEYDLPSGDPSPAFSKDVLIHFLTQQARSGSIIVMHMNGRGWHTAEALPQIIANLKDRGFVFVTVSELIGESNPTIQHKGYLHYLKDIIEKTYNKSFPKTPSSQNP